MIAADSQAPATSGWAIAEDEIERTSDLSPIPEAHPRRADANRPLPTDQDAVFGGPPPGKVIGGLGRTPSLS